MVDALKDMPCPQPWTVNESDDIAILLDRAEKERDRWERLAEDRRKMWSMDRDLCVELTTENRELRAEIAGLRRALKR